MIFVPGNFLSKRVTGTQRYAIEITKCLIAAKAPVRVLLTKDLKLPDWLPFNRCEMVPSLGSGRIAQFITFWVVAPLVLVWRYGQTNYYVWSPCNVGSPLYRNHIITIHDMAVRENAGWFSLAFVLFYRICFTVLSLGGSRVITVSNFSSREISRYYPCFGSRIMVIPNGVDSPKEEQVECPGRFTFDRRFILCVASKDPRKNLQFVVDAWSENSHALDGYLVMVGGGSSIFRSRSNFESCGSIIDLGYVSDSELAWLYRNCNAVVQASSYEGFGLPVTEALVRGAPVICSDIPAFREVAGAHGQYFELGSKKQLAELYKCAIIETRKSRCGFNSLGWSSVSDRFINFLNYVSLSDAGIVI